MEISFVLSKIECVKVKSIKYNINNNFSKEIV